MDKDNASIVAVIDDDNDVGDVLGGLLETMGYQVVTYRSGMDFLSDAKFDELAGVVYGPSRRRRFVELVRGLERLDDVRTLTAELGS